MKKTKTSKIIESCQEDSIASVECDLQNEDTDLDYSFLDENKNELYPITWCCKKGVLSLVEMMVKKGADPNRSFVENGKTLTVINWACKQNNASLIEILLQKGSKVDIDTFNLANEFSPTVLGTLSSKVPATIKELYHSNIYQAFESNNFNNKDLYIFVFNTLQANFIGIRQKNKGVIVDAGDAGSELIKTFKSNYKEAANQCDNLIEKFNKFKECPGKVEKPFITQYRTEPPATYNKVLDLCISYCPSKVDKLRELESKTVKDEESINAIINEIKESFLECESNKQRHPIRIFFSGKFEIDAVFLTHPHLDHFSLIDDLQSSFPDSFKHTKYILGGTQADWMNATRNSKNNWINVKNMKKSAPSYQSIKPEKNSTKKTPNEKQVKVSPNTKPLKKKIPSQSSKNKPASKSTASVQSSSNIANQSTAKSSSETENFPSFFFTGNEFDFIEYSLMDNVRFKVWGRTAPKNPDDKNQLSLLITMFFGKNNILFTGDAQGNLLQRMKIDRPNQDKLPHNDKFEKIVDEIIDTMKNARNSENYFDTNVIEITQQKLNSFLKTIPKEEVNQYREYINDLLAFEHSNIIFEPHHGSMTEESFDFYKYLSAQKLKTLSFICSYPMPKDYLPKDVCINEHKESPLQTNEHPITYAVNDSIPTVIMTKNPVYTTGSAGDNAYVLKISKKTVNILNLFEKTPKWETIQL